MILPKMESAEVFASILTYGEKKFDITSRFFRGLGQIALKNMDVFFRAKGKE